MSDVSPKQARSDAKAEAAAAKARAKAMRPFYKKKRFILPALLVILIIIISVSASSSSKKTEDAAAKTCGDVTYPDQQKKDFCADSSGTVSLQGMSVTATALAPKTDDIGGKALCSDVTLKNTSSKSQDYNVLDFKIQTPSGDVATMSTLSFASTLNSGTLIKGATKQGLVCSDDKGETGQYVFIYKPNPFDASRGVWLFTI